MLNYTVTTPDTDPPRVIGGTVEAGDKDVDPETINLEGKIEITFSEDVFGNIALQTEGGDDVGWLGKLEATQRGLRLSKVKRLHTAQPMLLKANSQTQLATPLMSVSLL